MRHESIARHIVTLLVGAAIGVIIQAVLVSAPALLAQPASRSADGQTGDAAGHSNSHSPSISGTVTVITKGPGADKLHIGPDTPFEDLRKHAPCYGEIIHQDHDWIAVRLSRGTRRDVWIAKSEIHAIVREGNDSEVLEGKRK